MHDPSNPHDDEVVQADEDHWNSEEDEIDSWVLDAPADELRDCDAELPDDLEDIDLLDDDTSDEDWEEGTWESHDESFPCWNDDSDGDE